MISLIALLGAVTVVSVFLVALVRDTRRRSVDRSE